MRIAFFCSCLEEGRDGVGDYMRQLAAECAAQSGGSSLLVALNDGDLAETEMERREEQAGMEAIRFNTKLSWEERAARLKPVLARFAPDAVSFHYVSYAFHPRGVALAWPEPLRNLFIGTPIHWMFHELWVGPYIGANLKERFVGGLQRYLIQKVIRKWKPRAIHTSNVSYANLLEAAGISTIRLPMYGAIPSRPPGDAAESFRRGMEAAGISFTVAERSDYWFGLFFGTLHANWPHQPLFDFLVGEAEKQKKKVVILSVGLLRSGERLWLKLQAEYGDRIRFIRLGEKSVSEVAVFFGAVDFGITTNPANILGKSSAAAAMMDHELPVLVSWEGAKLRLPRKVGGKSDENPLIWRLDAELPGKLASIDRDKRKFSPVLPLSARQVLRDLGYS